MKKLLVPFICLFFVCFLSFSQDRTSNNNGFFNTTSIDTIPQKEINVSLDGKTHFTDYKIISFKKDTTFIDTTLNITKEYRFNFLRKDLFGLLAFQNQGQTFNSLTHDFKTISTFPLMGIRAKQFNYLTKEDVTYFEVPTPTSEILYRTGLEQGQVLEALFTLNFSRRLNVGIQYKGLRSLGKYRNSLASQGNFRTVFSYNTKNERYFIRGHIAKQDLLNQENGGLTPTSMSDFINNDPNFKQRSRLDVHLEDTETNFEGTRYYLEHDYKLFSNKNSRNLKDFSNLKLGHSFTYESQFYEFNQTTINSSFFGPTGTAGNIHDLVENMLADNQFFLEFNSKYILGTFKVAANYMNYDYGYDGLINPTNTSVTIPKINGTAVGFGANWNAKINNFQLNSKVQVTPGSSFLSGSNIESEAIYKKDSLYSIKASVLINSKAPNFNTLLFQSSYDDYNWQNLGFKNVNTRNIHLGIDTKWIRTSIDFSNIENYTYFDENSQPKQATENVSYLKIKANNEFKFGKFALNNTLLFQKVSTGNSVFRVPDVVTRNTFYYADYWFEGKPLQVQIGTTLNYFSSYKADGFNPLLNEFHIQNTTEIGYPTVDVFFNAQVRRTRIFFKIENVTSSISKKNYFSAPNYPYRDFVIRFGLVWNWFI